jgi:hypothetical protein
MWHTDTAADASMTNANTATDANMLIASMAANFGFSYVRFNENPTE